MATIQSPILRIHAWTSKSDVLPLTQIRLARMLPSGKIML